MGVCCCVSYTNTASWVATAYITRYGNANAGAGPTVSPSVGFGDEVGLAVSFGDGIMALLGGGGSIADGFDGDFDGTMGSGNAAMASSAEAVSMVICVVGLWV